MDPILVENPSHSRHVLFPIQNDAAWELYKKAMSSFWRAEEIDLSKDLGDFHSLTSNEKYFVLHILAFFAASDGIVLENLAVRFLSDVVQPEVRCFYGFQIAMENIHSETYSLLIDTFADGPKQKEELFNAVKTYPAIRRKALWAHRHMNAKTPFAHRLIAFCVVEGIFFSGSFCAIFWLKKRGLMPGLTGSNEFISRDEALHTEFAVMLHNQLLEKCNEETIMAIVLEAVLIEKEFIMESLPCRLIGMNSKLMGQYIEYVADYLLQQLGCGKMFRTPNPFDFMEAISLDGKTNFFERRVTEYALANKEVTEDLFKFEADF